MVCDNRDSGSTVITASCTGTLAAGDLVYLVPTCQFCSTLTINSITSTVAAWSTLHGCTASDRYSNSTSTSVFFCWAQSTAGGSNPTFTVTYSALSGSFEGIDVFVFGNGGAGGWTVDTGPASCTSSSSTCTPANLTTTANAIFVGVFSTDASQSCTAGTGFTLRSLTVNARTCTQSSTSVEPASTTRSGSITGGTATWVGINVAFNEGGSPPPAVTCSQTLALMGVGCQ